MFHFHRRNMYYENENSTNGTSADLGFVLSQSWDRHVTRGTFQSFFVTSSIHFLVEPGSCRKIFVGHPRTTKMIKEAMAWAFSAMPEVWNFWTRNFLFFLGEGCKGLVFPFASLWKEAKFSAIFGNSSDVTPILLTVFFFSNQLGEILILTSHRPSK